MSNVDLTEVIENAVDDSVAPEPVETDSSELADTTAAADTETPPQDDSGTTAEAVTDEFAKKFGLASQSVTGRENRIPYSRVKKIVERAEKEAASRIRKELETSSAPKLTEYETKVKDYEDRLTKVAQFEHILENDPRQFLNILSQIPAYKEFFDYINGLASGGSAQPPQQSQLNASGMPQPDQTLTDGSTVYSMDGLLKRDEWLSKQIEERAVKSAEDRLAKRYAPMEQEWQSQQRVAQVVPIIQRQIAEARTWPHFTENEPAVVAALQADQTLSLDGAYRKIMQDVVMPRLSTDRNKIREEVLAEIKKAPVSTSAPRSATKPGVTPTGPRNLIDIVTEVAEGLK